MPLTFIKDFEPAYGQGIVVAPQITRITVNNPSAFTGFGTNSYIIGTQQLAVIDPGPEDEDHLQALLRVINGRPVSHIFVSHTHRDHSPLARALQQRTKALTVAQGPHNPARPLFSDEVNALDASADMDFMPDIRATDGQIFTGSDWIIETVLTPGHTANHACFAVKNTAQDSHTILFSADHVMGWATTIIAPPDGSMRDYMQSLEKLMTRKTDVLYLPGHGGPVVKPARFLRGLRAHRKMRERAVLERVLQGDQTIAEMVAVIYRDTDQRLHGAAGLSVFAHLEDLVARGLVKTDGDPLLHSRFTPA